MDLKRAWARALPGGAAFCPEICELGKGQKGIQMHAVFVPNEAKRATWDFPIHYDLSQSAGIRMQVYCRNPELISQFSIYLKNGNVWHKADFEITANEQWEEIFIPKTSFHAENTPSTWKNCDLLRIAGWFGSPGPVTIFLKELEFLRPNMSLAILRGAGNGNSPERQAKETIKYARHLNDALQIFGTLPAVIDEQDMSFTILRPYRMLLIPFPEAFAPQQIDTLAAYLRSGGKIGAFHALPPILAAQMGFPSAVGKFMSANSVPGALGGILPNSSVLPQDNMFRQLSTSFIGVEFLPQGTITAASWMNGSGQATKWPAVLLNSHAFWMTHVYLNQDPVHGGRFFLNLISQFIPQARQASAQTLLNKTTRAWTFASPKSRTLAQDSLAEAQAAYQQGRYQAVAECCLLCKESLLVQAETTVPIRANEIRGVWCRYPNGLPGHDWTQTLSLLSSSGFNTVFPMAATPYFAAYSTRLLRKEPGGGLPDCLNVAARKGIRVHAWMFCLGVEDAPEAWLLKTAREGRLQIGAHGETLNWLCPNHPENRKLLSRIAAELVSRNNVEGIHFDTIRYPAKNSCFCQTCRKAFEHQTGCIIQNWPEAVISGEYRNIWENFRIQSITSLFCELASAVNTARKNAFVSVAVYPDYTSARTSVGQDWVTWCRNQWVSFVSPMNYHASTNQFQADLKRQIQLIGQTGRILPGIGSSPQRLTADEVARQINATRAANLKGFLLFDLGQREAYEILPELSSKGVTR